MPYTMLKHTTATLIYNKLCLRWRYSTAWKYLPIRTSLPQCSAANLPQWDELLNLVRDGRDRRLRQVRHDIPQWRNNRNYSFSFKEFTLYSISVTREMLIWHSVSPAFSPTKCSITGSNMHMHASSHKSTSLSESCQFTPCLPLFFKIHRRQWLND